MAYFQNQAEACEQAARQIADWFITTQAGNGGIEGRLLSGINFFTGVEDPAPGWVCAFAAMGLLDAAKAFNDQRYRRAAERTMEHLRTLQIFNPFLPNAYGAVREQTPQTRWCWTRDSLSVAWSFLAYYHHGGGTEYLERAKLWGEWLFKHGMDNEGWPLWGVIFEDLPPGAPNPHMRLDVHGGFQGGGLSFLHQLAQATGNKAWVGRQFGAMADYLAQHIQQPDGYFASIEKTTKNPPEKDPQNNRHKFNDDFCTIGLLAAHDATGNKQYLAAVRRFLHSAFNAQRPDGAFEDNTASIPVILNAWIEAGRHMDVSAYEAKAAKALERLLLSRSEGQFNQRMAGAVLEDISRKHVCGRSSAYALLCLLKIAGKGGQVLSGKGWQ